MADESICIKVEMTDGFWAVRRLEEDGRDLPGRLGRRKVSIRPGRRENPQDEDIFFTGYADDATDGLLGTCSSREQCFERIRDSHARAPVASLHEVINQSCAIDGVAITIPHLAGPSRTSMGGSFRQRAGITRTRTVSRPMFAPHATRGGVGPASRNAGPSKSQVGIGK